MENHVRNVSLSVSSNGQFKVVGNSQQSLTFTKNGEQMAYFELEAAQQGVGKVKITATSGKEKATYEVEMGVYNPNPLTYAVQNAVLTGGQAQTLNTAALGEKNKTVLEISSFPGVNLHQRLGYLISYPRRLWRCKLPLAHSLSYS